jgi:hypothetical protein
LQTGKGEARSKGGTCGVTVEFVKFLCGDTRFFFLKRINFIVESLNTTYKGSGVPIKIDSEYPGYNYYYNYTTKQSRRMSWSGCIKREGEGRVDGRFRGEEKEQDVRRAQGRRGLKGGVMERAMGDIGGEKNDGC